MARQRGEGALGGDRAGEGWAREKEMTGGVGLPVRGVCARERAVRHWWAGPGGEWAGGARGLGRRGRKRGGGCGRARAGLEFGPSEGGERDFLFLFLF